MEINIIIINKLDSHSHNNITELVSSQIIKLKLLSFQIKSKSVLKIEVCYQDQSKLF